MVDINTIERLLLKYFDVSDASNYTINQDGSVDVEGNIRFKRPHPSMRQLPVTFNVVSGTFWANECHLTTLKGMPNVCQELRVYGNPITSLLHAPAQVVNLDIGKTQIKNFLHAPDIVTNIQALHCDLNSLEGLPECAIFLTWRPALPLLRLVQAKKFHVGTPGWGYAGLQPFEPVNGILQKYKSQGKPGALKAAAELIRAGHAGNAKW